MRNKEKITIVKTDHFSLEQILSSGQCFRMEQTEKNVYEVIAGDRYLRIGQGEEGTCLFYCEPEEYQTFWKKYFDLDDCYEEYLRKVDPADSYLAAAAEYGSGIRILHQDLWEMILTFVISQQNNIRRIRGIIRTLSERYGRECGSAEGKIYFSFPTPEELAGVSEEEFRACGLGYRSRYFVSIVHSVREKEVDLEVVKRMAYPEARKELMKLCGVGGKVADCICLFALHHLEAFRGYTH